MCWFRKVAEGVGFEPTNHWEVVTRVSSERNRPDYATPPHAQRMWGHYHTPSPVRQYAFMQCEDNDLGSVHLFSRLAIRDKAGADCTFVIAAAGTWRGFPRVGDSHVNRPTASCQALVVCRSDGRFALIDDDAAFGNLPMPHRRHSKVYGVGSHLALELEDFDELPMRLTHLVHLVLEFMTEVIVGFCRMCVMLVKDSVIVLFHRSASCWSNVCSTLTDISGSS